MASAPTAAAAASLGMTARGAATPRSGSQTARGTHANSLLALASGCPSGGGTLIGLKNFASGPGSARKAKVEVPLLPGYSTGQWPVMPQDFAKTQTLNYAPGGPHDALKGDGYTKAAVLPALDLQALEKLCDPSRRYDMSTRSITHDERESMKDSARNTYRPNIPPLWLKHDRQVLRFAAYFKEPVHENPKENFRIRHCSIYFHLEDGSMMITEPKVENSGIPQGTFVKRHKIPKPDNTPFTVEDLSSSETIHVYGRAFRIYDCDDFTRGFYRNRGVELPKREEPPVDTFRATRQHELESLGKPKNLEIIESKEYSKLSAGGNRKNEKLQQYLENDRKVLCFKAFWDDTTKYGARMYYTMHYYLADDTVEILENLARNSGRDPYPVFWKRSEIDRNPHMNPTPGMIEPEKKPYRPEDLCVGGTISVYGRELFLYDCDEFTRDFYRAYMDLEQDKIEIKDPQIVHVKLSDPPHSGFGTEEESLVSCRGLRRTAPKKDYTKAMREDGNVLRFEGKMMNGAAEDRNRRFVVAMHLADDSVGVWEKRQRNSGHAEGKFALKSRKKNAETNDWFKPQEFFLGAVVEVNAMPFALVGADAATVAAMEERCAEFPVADAGAIVAKLGPVKAALGQAAEPELSDEVFHAMACDAGLDLCLHEIVTLIRKFGTQEGHKPRGSIDTAKLLAAL